MEPGLKWRRKRSGRRLRPPFIAAPPANREGCWTVTWRGLRRAPCREALEASEGRSGASCRGARGRQWARLREARVAGAEGNNGGGTWESRGGTSIAGLRVRSEVALGVGLSGQERSDERARGAANPGPRRRRATVPLAWRAFCVLRLVRPTPVLRPQSPSVEPRRRRRLRPPGCSRKKAACTRSCSALARPPARRTRVLSSRRTRDEPPGWWRLFRRRRGAVSPLGVSAAGSPQPRSERPPRLAVAAAEGGACSDD